MSRAELTPWFGMSESPVRQGEYEGREKGSRATLRVYWRKLDDETEPDWYFAAGYYGPFRLWESASRKITAWRGLAKEPT